jgi:DNA-binding transcriptional MocR family regulator
MTDWTNYYATRAARMQASEIREILKLLDQPDIISFAGGIPDPELFPVAEIADACRDIFADKKSASTALQYAVSEGYLPLRQWIAAYMGKLGVTCTPDNILITNGSQQALDFVGKLFISPNDTVLVAWPTYLGALQAFNAYEAHYEKLPAPCSERSIESFRGKPKAKFGYVMPEFQNPTGTSLTKAERIALLNAAEALDLPLVEDAAYEHLRYDGERAPTLLTLASERAGGIDNAKVIYLGTFSKSIVPALRIGWMIGPKDVIRKMVLVKQGSDLHVSPFNQMIMQRIASTIIETHTAKIRAAYKTRRDAMLKALTAHMPAGVSWTKPEGGMFVWMTLPRPIDGAELLKRAITEKRIAFVPGYAFFADRSGRNTIRLNFSLNDPVTIDEGLKRLGNLISSM